MQEMFKQLFNTDLITHDYVLMVILHLPWTFDLVINGQV